MAISKVQLQKLLSRPELTSLDDIEVQPESIDADLEQTIVDPAAGEEEEFELDEEIPGQVEQLSKTSDKAVAGIPKQDAYKSDPAVQKALAKLINKDSDLGSTEVEQEVIADPAADMDLKKQAIAKIKRKYLGE